MSAGTPPHLTRSVNELILGYTCLSEEYKGLAERHIAIEKQLSLFRQQNEALRRLLPSNQSAPTPIEDVTRNGNPGTSLSSKNVVDCIKEIYGADALAAHKNAAAIESADLACFKLRTEMQGGKCGLDQTVENRALGGSQYSSGRKKARIAFPDMEQDMTVTRNPGKLGCPFAPPRQTYSNSVSKHDLPTPRSSGSHMSAHASRSHRMSFNDPLQTRAEKVPTIPSSNISEQALDDGPACPIRFLDQHSPEDVAKYFEEHKHELPPSHEACVKRFQTNAESIKELDAKYGSLVTMIQGLGQKHQPMLPEAPNPAEGALYEETKSSQRVKRWAKAVSDGHEPEEPYAERAHTTQSNPAGEERVSRFDRPLREIRVGESPSRPWGVPIPSKYLDRAEQAESTTFEDIGNRPAQDTTNAAVGPVLTPEAARQAPKGKCPFGHGAKSNDLPAPLNSNPPDDSVVQEAPKHDAAQRTETSFRPETDGYIVNHGLAIVAQKNMLQNLQLENRGTLLLGYSSNDAQTFAQSYSVTRR